MLTLTGGDKTPACTVEEDWRCDGGGYENYTLEVVDRMGTDSFTPDHGVLIAKNKTAELAPWKWVIDAHPEDIDKVDFLRPDGTPVKVTKGDYRQLADALFHAGTGPGVVSEYEDDAEPPALLRPGQEARCGRACCPIASPCGRWTVPGPQAAASRPRRQTPARRLPAGSRSTGSA